MIKLCILLPTINEDRCLNIIKQLSSFLTTDIKLFVYNQTTETKQGLKISLLQN